MAEATVAVINEVEKEDRMINATTIEAKTKFVKLWSTDSQFHNEKEVRKVTIEDGEALEDEEDGLMELEKEYLRKKDAEVVKTKASLESTRKRGLRIHIDKSTTIMSMSAAQARAALQEVMQYAEEGIHYDDDGELELLTERVPSYFDVRVNIRASIAANGEESLRARMLLARFTEAHDLRVDNSVDTSAYSLRKVVGWMCTEGMSDEGDVDMTKQQKGGTYMPTDFKQTLMTQAKKWGMFVENSKDEMKSGAAEILVLSCLKDVPQTPPQDFQDFPVIIANGVEYVLLDQLVDFIKKKPDDRNVIHEALHNMTEQALAGKDLINYRVRSVGWKLVAREADVALHAADGFSRGRNCENSLHQAARWQENNLRSDYWLEEAHVILWYRDWRTTFADLVCAALHNVETVSCLEIAPPGEGINICGSRTGQLSHHVQTLIRADKGVDTNGKTRYVIPLSLYSDKTHVDGRPKQSAYPLMMSVAERASDATLLAHLPLLQHRPRDKGWGLHSTTFRKQKAVILHKALSIVLRSAKEASHNGMIVTTERFGEITVHPFVMNYIQDYRERCALATVKFGVCRTSTVSKDDFDAIADFANCRRSQTLDTQLAANCFNNGDNDIRRAAETRMSELNKHKHVQENGLWGFYRGPHGDDPQLDYHLALQPDRMHTFEHGIFLHMIDAFKAAAYKKLPDIAQSEILHEMDARLQSSVRDIDGVHLPEVEGISNAALRILNELSCREDFRVALTTFMSENGCQPPSDDQVIHARTHLTIACTYDETHRDAGVQTARASPQFHGRAVHSDVAVRGGNRSRGMAAEAGKRPERVDEEHLFPFTWKSRRHAIAITKRDVLRLGAKQWLNDDVIDMYLQSVYEEHFLAQDNTTLHVCTTFSHPAVIVNQKVYVAKWQERIKSRPAKLCRISNQLRKAAVVRIPVNHKTHWKLLLLLNVSQFLAVTEDNDGQK
ncbi:hypothetical protein CBR_g39358 [Chara braunii]|uniref:Ubiquitin-like protease family profile domain-containing protein n=1 Tax=Chara braunii TaxID=69332 RepID=A0A388LRG1_CHABU|nr:hypothetical protein CBR_g39358 [Chara braunii]|eukprot:GBG84897.1 hypothetical protein CBR_g39358 [Chara braunii]